MKTPHDPRHRRRQILVQELFKTDFYQQKVTKEAAVILKNKELLDAEITKYAPEFPIEKINRVDLAILRLSLFELHIEKKEPTHVIIDEAVELAKEFGGKTSANFVNGVLGSILKHEFTS